MVVYSVISAMVQDYYQGKEEIDSRDVIVVSAEDGIQGRLRLDRWSVDSISRSVTKTGPTPFPMLAVLGVASPAAIIDTMVHLVSNFKSESNYEEAEHLQAKVVERRGRYMDLGIQLQLRR